MNPQNKPSLNKIYFVWNYHEWGGVQIYFLGLMRTVLRKYRVKAVLPNNPDKKILQYLKENNIEYDFFEGRLDFEKAETIQRKIKRRSNDFFTNLSLLKYFSQIDLKNSAIQIDVAPWAGFFLLFYLTFRTKVFVTFHTAMPQVSFWRYFLWKLKFLILSVSSNFHMTASNLDVKKSLRPFVSKNRYDEIEIVYSSFNLEEVGKALNENKTRLEIAKKYNFPAEKIWICNVAQFIERKGCWVFLEAAKILAKQRSDLFFFWLGTTPLKKETIEKIGEFNLKNNFRFLSADDIGRSRGDLLALLKEADLFVLPSYQEGLPMALIEAMALGKACIASQINAIPEVIKNFETGILINAGNSAKLAQQIGELANNKLLRKELGENAQKFVFENFEEKITGKKMLQIYEKSNLR